MRNTLQKTGLILTGLFAGILISLNYSASADRAAPAPLPVEELRAFADVFNAVKQGYVEPVEDRDLINHAISGMLTGLDPHSAYLDAEARLFTAVLGEGDALAQSLTADDIRGLLES